jgi:hypothetical protein
MAPMKIVDKIDHSTGRIDFHHVERGRADIDADVE